MMTKYYALDKNLNHTANDLRKCDNCKKIFFNDERLVAEWTESHGEVWHEYVCPHCHKEDITNIDETDFETFEEMESKLYENDIYLEDLEDYDDIMVYFEMDIIDYEYTDAELDAMEKEYEYKANIGNTQKLIGAQ